VYVVK